MFCITVLPQQQNILSAEGENLLQVLRYAGLAPDAPCGGKGTCGKCKVMVNGKQVLACQTTVTQDMVVTIPQFGQRQILTAATELQTDVLPLRQGYFLAFDIGTTTVAGYILDKETGNVLASESAPNPQSAFGADVISRIQWAIKEEMQILTDSIRACVDTLSHSLCEKAGILPAQVGVISLVGNPAMQQLFLGILPKNLAQIPFAPVLTKAEAVNAKPYLPGFENALLLIVPDIAGFVGADTLAGVLATGIHQQEELSLLVDIGTNGEMVLGNRHRMVACSTAAGPALEGANIQFGMGGRTGAIDHVWLEDGKIEYSVIGHCKPIGICGSGLMDAVAVALDQGLLNERGRILTENRLLHLTEEIYLTQEDIRQVQMAKGAIAAGISLMAAHLGVTLQDIQHVYLAGAFGTYMRPSSACRMGLLPVELEGKIQSVGNAAGGGGVTMAVSRQQFELAGQLASQIEFLELATAPGFQRCFAAQMLFDALQDFWIRKALSLGFTHAAPLDISTLQPRQDVRDQCSADKCGAYGKNWTCPPHCGTLSQCAEKMGSYRRGILLQTVGQMRKLIDTKAYRETEQRHLEQFHRLLREMKKAYPQALGLGSGGCRVCASCAWPEPCRFPQEACASMEGYGLFVTQVCRDNGCQYHYGEKTITYTACILF